MSDKKEKIRKNHHSVLNYIFDPTKLFDKRKYLFIKKHSEENLIIPLRVITLLIAISGLFAMVFEVRYFSEYVKEVYFTRLSATLVAFTILVILYTKHALKRPVLLVHILLLTIIISSGYMIYLMPSTLIVNTQIVGLMIFTSALFLSWEIKNQILVAIYYNIVFAGAIIANKEHVYFLPNIFESILFVVFLSLISIVGSAVNFRLRSEAVEKTIKMLRSEKRFRSIIKNSAEGIFQTSIDGRFFTVNLALAKMLGFNSEEELKKVNVKSLFYNPDDRNRLIEILKKKGEVKDYQLTLRRRDGKTLIVKINDKLVKDKEEGIIFFEGTVQDITEQIKLEKERRLAIEQLRAEKIKSDNLLKEALKSSEIKSQFVANMSHEIRTPMNGVLGFLNLILQGAYRTQTELVDYVSSAKASAENLLDLINDMLDFSKIEAGKLVLDESNFNLNDLVNEAVATVITIAKEKGLEISTTIETGTHLHLIGDANRLRRIYINLLSNAVKFTEKGGIKIHLSSEKFDENRVKITSFVEDTGLGIPPDKMTLLFKPFSQLDGAHTRKHGGTGLGLAICKELVSLMNGSIKVESLVGRGSKFTFSVILQIQKQPSFVSTLKKRVDPTGITESRRQANILFSDQLQKARSGYSILLVEDNPVNQKVAIKVLTQAGYNIEAANNGFKGVERLKLPHNFNLILMDIQMPEMDGFTATQHIRAMNDGTSNLPIIAMTAHALMGDRDKCIAAGMNDYISKPIKTEELVKMVDKWLNIVVEDADDTVAEEKTSIDELFDKAHFNSVSMEDPEFQKELLITYLNDMEKRIEKLDALIKVKDFGLITSESHTIKGASLSLGIIRVGNYAKEIEFASKKNDFGTIIENFSLIKKAFEATKVILQPYIN